MAGGVLAAIGGFAHQAAGGLLALLLLLGLGPGLGGGFLGGAFGGDRGLAASSASTMVCSKGSGAGRRGCSWAGGGVDEVGEVVGFVGRVPGWGVPAGEDLLALSGGEAAERAASAAPGGGGVVAHALQVDIGGGVQAGDALLGGLGGLEFGEEGDFVGLALEGAAGGRRRASAP